METITITLTETQHINKILTIENKCFSFPWTRQDFEFDIYNREIQSCYSAIIDGEVVGYIVFSYMFEEGELLNIAVDPNMRCMGIAQKLIDKMFEVMLEKDVTRILLEVRESNTPAKNLYTKNGFKEFSIRKNYYKKPLENAICMEKQI